MIDSVWTVNNVSLRNKPKWNLGCLLKQWEERKDILVHSYFYNNKIWINLQQQFCGVAGPLKGDREKREHGTNIIVLKTMD